MHAQAVALCVQAAEPTAVRWPARSMLKLLAAALGRWGPTAVPVSHPARTHPVLAAAPATQPTLLMLPPDRASTYPSSPLDCMAAEKASTSTPGMRTYTPTRLTTINPTSAASFPGRGPLKKLPQLKPSSSVEDMGLVGLLLLGVATLRVAVLPLLPDGVIVPLPLPLPEGLGGASGTLGCVSVSDSAAFTSTSQALPLITLLLLLLMPSLQGPPTRLGRRPVHTAFRRLCDRAAPRTLLPCI